MIRENQKLFNTLNVFFDVIIVIFSVLFIKSYIFTQITGLSFIIDYDTTISLFVVLFPSYLVLYSLFNLYAPQRTNKSIFSESSKIIQANLVEFLLLTILSSLDIINITENFFVCLLLINLVFAVIERAIVRIILRFMRRRGFNIKYILIIGAGEIGEKLVSTINENPYLGYKIIGFLDDNTKGYINGIKVIGRIENLESILSTRMVDRVIVSISPRHYQVLDDVIDSCEKMGVRADIMPDYYRYVTSHPNIELIDNVPLISVRYLPLDITYNKYLKRIFDVIFVICASILLSPLLLITAVLIKCTSKGPVIYKQKRVGLDGKPFKIYKFRSMKSENSYIDEVKWTEKNDPRITRVGKIIRKTSIDELPQFFNILKGDMSLIGPRPERPYFVNKFRESVPKYMIKHHVRPGMTGWAQINGYRGNTSIVKRIEYDIYYVENWTVTLDFKIFFKTIPALFTDSNAY